MKDLDRRRFLLGSGTALAGAAASGALAAGCGSPARRADVAASARPDALPAPDVVAGGSWADVRAQFVLRPDLVHLSTFFFVSHPKPVREAIERFRAQLDLDPYGTVHGRFGNPERDPGVAAKHAAAAYLGGDPDEIALTQSTTMGLGIVYQGLPLRPGDEILTTAHDHYVHHEAQRLAAARCGASVRRIALFDRLEDLPALSEEQIVERIRSAVRPETRVVGLTWVHSSSGLKLPLRAISAALRELDAGRDERDRLTIVVDGVHGFGVEDETIAETGCDVFVAGTHKWIFGPRGTGLVWARAGVWARLALTMPTFDSRELFQAWAAGREPATPPRAAWFTPGGFHAFEHEWAVAAAFAFHEAIGRARVAARIHELNGALKEGLAALPRVRLYTPRGDALSSGLVGFDVEGLAAREVVGRLLERRIVASESPYARSIPRLAAGVMNTPEEVDAALRAVREIAG